MTMRRTLTLATAVAAVLTLGTVPAVVAQSADGETQILRSDTWKPGYMKTNQGDYVKVVPTAE